ncbi:MAG: type 4a pilus biogenesis protein PilO [Nitrospirota bacterium]|nr:type 4a pilus biogenesis protein PilO [Nitrospirota bacterium]
MKNQKKGFYIILAAVIVTGLIFSLYTFSKIRSIHQLRAAIEKTGAERTRAIEKESGSSTDAGKALPQRMWTTEFIETAYTASRKYGIRDLTFEQKPVDSSRRQAQGNGRISLQAYPVRMTFHAGYREMAEFIQELQGLERLVTIDSLKVKREKGYLAVEMTATTYAMEGK